MNLQWKIKIDLFLASFLLFSFFAFSSFFIAFAKSEGNLGNNLFTNFLADYSLYLFPFYFFVIGLELNSWLLIFIAFLLNVVIYAFLFSILLYGFFKKKGSHKPFLLSYYVTLLILLIPTTYFIILIFRG